MDCKELVLGQPKSFEDATQRAVTTCQQMGNEPGYHFAGAGNMIAMYYAWEACITFRACVK